MGKEKEMKKGELRTSFRALSEDGREKGKKKERQAWTWSKATRFLSVSVCEKNDE